MAELLFEIDEYLADPANPSHALCSTCGIVQPIENYKRKASALQAAAWGWDEMQDKKNALFTSNECNKCATKRAHRARYFDYTAYDRKLYLSGKYEFMVKDPRFPNRGDKFITQRQAMVLAVKQERLQRKVEGGRKAIRSRYADDYTRLLKQVTAEIARVKYQRNKMETRTPEACIYLDEYTAHLKLVRENIKLEKQAALKPKDSPVQYVNHDALLTQNAKALYRSLRGGEREIVASKFLGVF